MLFDQIPVEPGDFVVLAIRIVIAVLRSTTFVAGQDHRDALAEQQAGKHVFDLLFADFHDARIASRSLGSVVVAHAVVVAVTIAFAIHLIVFLVVANEVIQRKSIV